jgi:hypothetical protein
MLITEPIKTFFRLYTEVLSEKKVFKTILYLMAGLLIGWWIYVPVHELLHVVGCLLGGGEVSQLEIVPLYGGHVFSRIFSFVTAEGPYAGRLSGFDTHGSDWIYALTIFFPFILSLPGFRLLVWAGRRKSAFVFGFFVPCTLAPIISLTGDFFELGSLALYQIWPGPSGVYRSLISDDMFLTGQELFSGQMEVPFDALSLLFVLVSFLIGLTMVWLILMASHALRGHDRQAAP